MNPGKAQDVAGMRVEYGSGELTEDTLGATPLAQFDLWLGEAIAAGLPEPNAMVLATADGHGVSSARMVLLKGIDADGFCFFSHHGSRKGRAMAENPRVSLVFPWHARQRQVIVLGRAEQLPREVSEGYFHSRPRSAQLAAWASEQSSPMDGRGKLNRRMEEFAAQWPEGTEIPMPAGWGGYRVKAESVEFWQGRPDRLHDRLRFEAKNPQVRLNDPEGWRVQRYAP